MKRLYFTICILLSVIGSYAASNLASSASVTASSSAAEGYGPEKAIDMTNSTVWRPATAKGGEWIMLSWDTERTINRLEMMWQTNYAKSFKIYALDSFPDSLMGKRLSSDVVPDSVLRKVLPDSALVCSQGERSLSDMVETVDMKEFTTKKMLILMGTSSAAKEGIKLDEINLYYIEIPKLTTFTVSPLMVRQGVETPLRLRAYDQENQLLTKHVGVSVPDSVGTLTGNILKPTRGGWITITALDSISERKRTVDIYVVSDDDDAPDAPAAGTVYASLLPASSGSTTTYTSTLNNMSQPADEWKMKGCAVKMVRELGSLTITNETLTNKLDSVFNPQSKLYETFHFEIFSPVDAKGMLSIRNVRDIPLTLKAGSWTKIDCDLSEVSRMGNIDIELDKTAAGRYPDVLLANIYFTKSPVRLSTLTVEPRFIMAKKATKLSLTAKDQIGTVITEHLVYSVPEGSGAKMKGDSIYAAQHGWLTITATDTITTRTASAQLYVLGDEDAPAAPDSAAVYAGLLPATKGTTVYTANRGNKAQPADIVALKKQQVKIVYELGTLVINNSDVSSALDKTFNPAAKFYGKLHLEIFSPTNTTGSVKVDSVGEQKVAVNAATWQKVEFDVSKISKMGNIIVNLDKQSNGSYPHVLLANIYFTKSDVDSTDYLLTNLEAANTFIPKNRAVDLKLSPKNKKGVEVTVYGVSVTYTADKGSFDKNGLFTTKQDGPITIVGTATKDDIISRDTIIVYTYPDPDRQPTIVADSVVAIYSDTYGAVSYTPSATDKNGGYGTQRELELTLTDHGIYVERAVCFGLDLDNITLAKCDSIHFSIYSYADFNGRLQIEGTQMTNLTFALKANRWNRISLPLSGTRDQASWLNFYVGGDGLRNRVIIDNIYFSLDPKYGIIERFVIGKRFIHKNQPEDMQLHVYNRLDTEITDDVLLTADKGTFDNPRSFTTTQDGPITITATGALGSSISIVVHTLPEPAATPTDLARRVKAVYSDTYGANDYTLSGDYSEQYEVTMTQGDRAIAALDVQTVSFKLNNLDLTDYIWLKASVFVTNDFNGYVEIEGTHMEMVPVTFKRYQWTDLKLILTDFREGATALKFTVGDNNTKNNVVIDNVIFVKMDPGELDVAKQPDVNGFITVLGTVTGANQKLIESITAGAVDLTKATIDRTVYSLGSKNPNTIYLVPGEFGYDGELDSDVARQLSGTRNMVLRRSDGAYVPIDKIELTDDPNYPVWGGIIKTGDKGYTYSRIFYPGATTLIFPEDYTFPAYNEKSGEGFILYSLYAYDADYGITVARQHTPEAKKNHPYVVIYKSASNTRKGVRIEGTGDLDLRDSACESDWLRNSSVGLCGTFSGGNNTNWFSLRDGGNKLYFDDVDDMNPIPPFRAYFTGCQRNFGRRVQLFEGSSRLIISELDDDPQGSYIIGPINSETLPSVQAVNKCLLDFTDATIDKSVTTITPANKNALICVYGYIDNARIFSSVADQLTGTRNLVIKDERGNLYAYSKIEIEDDGVTPVWTTGTVSTSDKGYTYTRTIAAYDYVTATLPMSADVPEGIEVYQLTDYESARGVVLTRTAETTLAPYQPYVLFNSTDQPITLTASATGVLDMRQEQVLSVKGEHTDIRLTGNFAPSAGDGSLARYGLATERQPSALRSSPSTPHRIPKLNVSLTRYAAEDIMPPFRAYFTHVPVGGNTNVTIVDDSKHLVIGTIADAQGFIPVTGLLDNSNVQQVEAVNAGGLDLSQTIFDDTFTTINTSNPNMLVLVSGTIDTDGNIVSPIAKQLKGTKNIVVRDNNGNLMAATKINLVDSDEQPIPWGNIVVDTKETGYSYRRTFPAGAITTAVVPEYVMLPNGMELYTNPYYDNKNRLILYLTGATQFSKGMPYVVCNTTDEDITISFEGNGYLDLRSSASGTWEDGPIAFHANYNVIRPSVEQPVWLISAADTTFHKFTDNTTLVPPFRAYITGMPDGTPVHFINGHLSNGITEVVVDDDRNGKYYTLDGRPVATPRKNSLYIRNGRVVVYGN